MASLPDLVEIRSISRFGLSIVTIVFDEEVDTYFARTLVDQRLGDAASDPAGVGDPMLAPVSTGLGEVYQYVLHADDSTTKKFTASATARGPRSTVTRQLLGTPGVAEANSFGGEVKQYEVAVDPKRLQSMDVTIGEVFTALESNNENTGGAYIDKRPNSYSIRGVGPAYLTGRHPQGGGEDDRERGAATNRRCGHRGLRQRAPLWGDDAQWRW